MKIVKKDKVMVITGRDKGKVGEVLRVLPSLNKVVVEGVGTVKKHVKPNQSNPKGGIVEEVRPIDASKVMILDPASSKPARIGYKINAKGKKERIFKVSKFKNTKKQNSEKKENIAKGEVKKVKK